ncbi:MAG TPA: hypothetical protein VJH55_01780 [Candidatus Paceibacterota bacterium]
MKKLFAILFFLFILFALSGLAQSPVYWDSTPYGTPTYQKTESYSKYEMQVKPPLTNLQRHFGVGASSIQTGYKREYLNIETGGYSKTVSKSKDTYAYEQWNSQKGKPELVVVKTESGYKNEEKRPALNPQPIPQTVGSVKVTTWTTKSPLSWFKK